MPKKLLSLEEIEAVAHRYRHEGGVKSRMARTLQRQAQALEDAHQVLRQLAMRVAEAHPGLGQVPLEVEVGAVGAE